MDWQYAIYYFITALGMITGAIRFKKLSVSNRVLLLLIINSVLAEIIATYLRTVFQNNLIVSRIYPLISYGLTAVAFQKELPHFKKYLDLSILIVLTVALLDTIINYNNLLQQYPSFQKVVISLLTIGICLLFLYSLLEKESDYSFIDYPLFWVSLGSLLYSIITLFSFTAFNYIGNNAPEFVSFFTWVRIFANLVLYSLFIVGFMTKQRRLADL